MHFSQLSLIPIKLWVKARNFTVKYTLTSELSRTIIVKNRFMKKSFMVILLTASFSSFFGCKKSSSNSSTTGSSTYYIKATIGSTNFSAAGKDVGATYTTDIFNFVGNTPTQMIQLGIFDTVVTVGSDVPLDNISGVANYFENGSPHASSYGTIHITSATPNIQGTFSFTCTDSTKVTNGTFSVMHP